MRKAQTLLILLAFVSSAMTSCNRDESRPDYAGIIAGTYTGTVTTASGTVSGSSTIVKRSETKVDMAIIAGTHNQDIFGISVSKADDNVYSLSYTIAGNSLVGEVEGNTLTYTLSSGVLTGTFTGTR